MNNESKYRINSVEEFVKAVEEIYNSTNFKECKKHLFFRGQSNEEWYITPRIARNGGKEKTFVLDFHHYSASHSIDYDLDKDRVSLLEDMQHYGIPTRLLDWTVAPLNALFFAVENKIGDKDAVVYVLDPWKYNKELLVKYDKTYSSHPKIHDAHIYARALLSTCDDLKFIKKVVKKRFGYAIDDKELEYPFAFVSNYKNQRVRYQKGSYTIMGTSNIDMMNQVIFQNNYTRIFISNDKISDIYEQLHRLYINEYTVYPDLEGMQKLFARKQGLFKI